MPFFDMPLDELRAFRPERDEPADFDDFWQSTLAEARGHDIAATFTPYDTGLTLVDSYDVRFAGFGGQPVAGWFMFPHGAVDRLASPSSLGPTLPTVIRYLGYGGGRGHPLDWLAWPCAGYAFLVMDTRGQGSAHGRPGATGDAAGTPHAHVPGFVTRGLTDPHDYYYRRVFTDAVRAVDAVRTHALVDRDRIFVLGASQGGAIAQAVAGLTPGLAGAVVDVPFLCHFRRAVEITDKQPYKELTTFLSTQRELADQAFTTLSYFDGVNLAPRATAPALYTTALMDDICPPSTVFAAYNWYGGPKEIDVYPYNQHEGGGMLAEARALRFVRGLVG